MVLREETDSRDKVNSVRLSADVAVSGKSLQFATAAGGDHGKQEGELDREVDKRRLAEGLKRGTRQEA